MNTTIVGFDSAWTDKASAPGAVCAIRVRGGSGAIFEPPRLATFRQALAFIRAEQDSADRVVVALDQPTIVPNHAGSRPVDKVAGSLVSWLGGGVQPANRSKLGMFDDNAPVWRFKDDLCAHDDPQRARLATDGVHLIEVFPALSLPFLIPSHCGRLLGAKYNPGRRKTFRQDHWENVAEYVADFGIARQVAGLSAWGQGRRAMTAPRKSDQDLLDAALCAILGYLWLFADRSELLLIGDLASGYMATPALGEARNRLLVAARTQGVAAV